MAYLVLHGELPSKNQLKKFIKEERSNRKLSKTIIKNIEKMPKNAHPMDAIRTCVSLMAIKLTQVRIASIGWAFLGIFSMFLIIVLESFLLDLSSLMNFLS